MYLPTRRVYIQKQCELKEIAKALNDIKQEVLDIVSYQVVESDRTTERIVIVECEVVDG